MKEERALCWTVLTASGGSMTALTVRMWAYAVKEKDRTMRSLKWLLSKVCKRHVKTFISVIIFKSTIHKPDVKKQVHFTFLRALQNKWDARKHLLKYNDMLIHVHRYNEIHSYMYVIENMLYVDMVRTWFRNFCK